MPKNIFEKEFEEKGIFKREEYLLPEFVPERLPHRDKEIDSIVFSLKPLLKGKKASNLFLFGSTGTGKTVTIKFVLNELQEYSDKAKAVYINCFEFNSRHAILTRIANFLGNATPRRGIGSDEVLTMIIESMKKIDYTPIIVLDEVDQLLYNENASKLLYDLLRINQFQENLKKTFVIILITNDASLPLKLDERVKSSLIYESLEFKQYTPQQLKDILKERCEFAFNENVLEKEVINLAAAFAAKNNGDARIAIESLFKAGKIAEKEGASKVTVEHLRKAFNLIYSRFAQKSMNALDEDEKFLLKILLEKKELNAGKLYSEFSKKKNLSERSIRKKINKLASMNLIKVRQKAHENKGMTRIISLAVDENSIKELILKN